jgi:hypothetical protein
VCLVTVSCAFRHTRVFFGHTVSGTVGAVTERLHRLCGSGGQAAVELVLLLPLLVLVVGCVWQLAVAGHAAWAASAAARAAARAAATGADARRAALARLPRSLERGLRVRSDADGTARVVVRVPAVLAGLHVGTVSSEAHFEPQAP